MANIGWGKNRHFVRNITKNAGIRELPTPVEDSFELATEKGDKLEAKIEGGEYKDVRYKKNTNSITFDIFVAKGEKKPFADKQGVIEDEFEYWEQPEDAAVPAGIHISRARVSCEVKSNTAEGMKLTYVLEPLKPSDSSIDPMQMGVVTVTESGSVISAINFTELEAEDDDNTPTVTVSPTSLSFAASSAPAQAVTVSGAASITSARANRSWLTVTFAGTSISVSAADNANTSARTATVTVVANGETVRIPVDQAGA
mgnify:CR=1 FL=1